MSLDLIASRVLAAVPSQGRASVAIDGVGASGKTTFARALAEAVTTRPVILLHTDDFFNAAAIRHARGRNSPEGFWRDAFNTPALRTTLDHLRADGDGRYRVASIDRQTGEDREEVELAPPDALVLVEGVFLHRAELADYWDCSIWLDVEPAEAARRMIARDGLAPDDPRLARYAGAQRLYDEAARPRERATLVVDMTTPSRPRLLDSREG